MEWIKIFSSQQEARERLAKKRTQLVIIGARRICVAFYDGKFFAVQDSCTHNGESLSGGQINYAGEIICPWHNYRFELNTGKSCEPSCRDLITYPVKADEDGFFVGI